MTLKDLDKITACIKDQFDIFRASLEQTFWVEPNGSYEMDGQYDIQFTEETEPCPCCGEECPTGYTAEVYRAIPDERDPSLKDTDTSKTLLVITINKDEYQQ